MFSFGFLSNERSVREFYRSCIFYLPVASNCRHIECLIEFFQQQFYWHVTVPRANSLMGSAAPGFWVNFVKFSCFQLASFAYVTYIKNQIVYSAPPWWMFEDFGLDFELRAAIFVLNVHPWVYFRILAGNCLLTLGHVCFTTNWGSISMKLFYWKFRSPWCQMVSSKTLEKDSCGKVDFILMYLRGTQTQTGCDNKPEGSQSVELFRWVVF